MKKGKVFQEDFFELDPAAFAYDLFIWQAARFNSLKPLDVHIYTSSYKVLYLSIKEAARSIYILLKAC
jgi:hypothetical protein